jgi:hypothetical protein
MPPMPEDAKTKDLGTAAAEAGPLDVCEEVAKTMGENMVKQKDRFETNDDLERVGILNHN